MCLLRDRREEPCEEDAVEARAHGEDGKGNVHCCDRRSGIAAYKASQGHDSRGRLHFVDRLIYRPHRRFRTGNGHRKTSGQSARNPLDSLWPREPVRCLLRDGVNLGGAPDVYSFDLLTSIF